MVSSAPRQKLWIVSFLAPIIGPTSGKDTGELLNMKASVLSTGELLDESLLKIVKGKGVWLRDEYGEDVPKVV